MYAMCSVCGNHTFKEEICYKCRVKPERTTTSLSDRLTYATSEQEMTPEQAEQLYNDAMERLSIDHTDQQAWHDKRRASARLSREEIDTNTLI